MCSAVPCTPISPPPLPPVQPAPGLRERDFGELEGRSHEEYDAVWVGDAVSAANRAGGEQTLLGSWCRPLTEHESHYIETLALARA